MCGGSAVPFWCASTRAVSQQIWWWDWAAHMVMSSTGLRYSTYKTGVYKLTPGVNIITDVLAICQILVRYSWNSSFLRIHCLSFLHQKEAWNIDTFTRNILKMVFIDNCFLLLYIISMFSFICDMDIKIVINVSTSSYFRVIKCRKFLILLHHLGADATMPRFTIKIRLPLYYYFSKKRVKMSYCTWTSSLCILFLFLLTAHIFLCREPLFFIVCVVTIYSI